MHIDGHVTELPAARARIYAWPPMLPTFAMLVAVAIFVTAGNWQRARMDAKESLRAQLDAATARGPAPLPRNAGGTVVAALGCPAICRSDASIGVAGCDRGNDAHRRRRRARPRSAGARPRHRAASDLHGPVVCIRCDGARVLGLVRVATAFVP